MNLKPKFQIPKDFLTPEIAKFQEFAARKEKEFIPSFNRMIADTFKEVIDKEVGELNDHEKAVIAYIAGVPCGFVMEDGRLILRTEPCTITKPNGKWWVSHRQPGTNTTTTTELRLQRPEAL